MRATRFCVESPPANRHRVEDDLEERRDGRRAPGATRPARLGDLRPRAAGGAGRARRAGVDRREDGLRRRRPRHASTSSRRSPCRRRSSQPEACDPDVVRRLTRRPALARRYLAVEGHRALAAIEDLLPPSLRSLIDFDVAARADSPAASLASALSREAIADPPECFGAIRARPLLASIQPRRRLGGDARARSARAAQPGAGRARTRTRTTTAPPRISFSSPVGGGGALGRLAAADAGGGAPARRAVALRAPTRRRTGRATGTRGERQPRFSTANGGDAWKRPPSKAGGRSTPSGTFIAGATARTGARCRRSSRGRKDGTPFLVSDAVRLASTARPSRHGPRSPSPAGAGRRHRHRCGHRGARRGDGRVGARRGGLRRQPSPPARSLRARSCSTSRAPLAEPGCDGPERCTSSSGRRPPRSRVALHEIGDRVALYAYHSRGRSAVHAGAGEALRRRSRQRS